MSCDVPGCVLGSSKVDHEHVQTRALSVDDLVADPLDVVDADTIPLGDLTELWLKRCKDEGMELAQAGGQVMPELWLTAAQAPLKPELYELRTEVTALRERIPTVVEHPDLDVLLSHHLAASVREDYEAIETACTEAVEQGCGVRITRLPNRTLIEARPDPLIPAGQIHERTER